VDVGGFQHTVCQRTEVTGTRGTQQRDAGGLRGRPDVVTFRLQTFVVGEVCQHDLAQNLGLFVGVVTDHGAVVVDLVAHQVARFKTILAGSNDVVRTGVLLHGVRKTHGEGRRRGTRNGRSSQVDVATADQRTVVVEGQRRGERGRAACHATVLGIHFPGVSRGRIFNVKQVHVVRITLAVKDGDRTFFVVG